VDARSKFLEGKKGLYNTDGTRLGGFILGILYQMGRMIVTAGVVVAVITCCAI
jgi:hypothetical protein